MSYINLNGNVLAVNEAKINIMNRSFRYGDGLFESIRLVHDQIPFLPAHMERLKAGADFLNLEFPEGAFTADVFDYLSKMNGVKGNGSIRIMLFRKGEGKYTPDTDESSYIISVDPVRHEGFPLNEKGLSLGVSHKATKPLDRLANFKTNSALVYVLAGQEKEKQGVEEVVVLNSHGRVAEVTSSNIFIVKDDMVLTPSLEEGPVSGVMRGNVIRFAADLDIPLKETAITLEDLKNADEVFITNAIQGIRWIGSYDDLPTGQAGKTYAHPITSQLSDKLNQSVATLA